MHLVYRMVLDNVNLVLKSFRLARMVACFHCFSLILMMPSDLPIMNGGTQEVKCRIYLREALGWLVGLFSFRYRTKVGREQLKHENITQTKICLTVRQWQGNDITIDKRRLVLMKRKEIKIGKQIQI